MKKQNKKLPKLADFHLKLGHLSRLLCHFPRTATCRSPACFSSVPKITSASSGGPPALQGCRGPPPRLLTHAQTTRDRSKCVLYVFVCVCYVTGTFSGINTVLVGTSGSHVDQNLVLRGKQGWGGYFGIVIAYIVTLV